MQSKLTVDAGSGTHPVLPNPDSPLIPTVHVATAKGWTAGTTPTPASGLAVNAFAQGLQHPRWLCVLPNGDVLVAETDAPPKPEDGKGIRGWVMGKLMKKAGSGTPSADRITLLRDADGDGVAETRTVFLSGLDSPFGMALVGDVFYVADTNALLRFPYRAGETEIREQGTKVTDLPAGPLNHHWTKNVIASRDGAKLYVTVGSNSNVMENGADKETGRAAILEIDAHTGSKRTFATGLRNPNGMDFEPKTGVLWTAVNERDELGNDLVPDYITSVRDGAFYGWPYSYYGQHVDVRAQPPRPDLVARATVPDYAVGSHTASLGFAFYEGDALPQYRGGAFVGQHGSWNRRPFSGYRVIHVPFENGKATGVPTEVLTGFVDDNGEARGRPVGVAVDRKGALLVADDVGNHVWRVTALGSGAVPSG
ncbi:MAG: sorbosone dehydrogenase family protein [Rhodanobacteraceae bacterium]